VKWRSRTIGPFAMYRSFRVALTVWARLGSDRTRWQNDVLGLRAAAIFLSLLTTSQISRSVRARLLVADRMIAYWCHMSDTPVRCCRSDSMLAKSKTGCALQYRSPVSKAMRRKSFVCSRRGGSHVGAGNSMSRLAYCKPGRTKTGLHRKKNHSYRNAGKEMRRWHLRRHWP
jgi:hypothetical protein